MSLDRDKVTDRASARGGIATCKALGVDPNDYNLSYSTSYKERRECRKLFDINAKASFSPSSKLSIHYDGKLVREEKWKVSVDKLPVVVCGLDIEKLLGVATLSSGTGKNIGNAVHQSVLEWGLADKGLTPLLLTPATRLVLV